MKERIRLLCRTLRQGSPAVTAIVTGCRGALSLIHILTLPTKA